MARHPRQLAETDIYHVTLRGVNRDAIFLDDDDHERFLVALRAAKEASGCRVFAYCLMTNHVHLVLRSEQEPIGVVMKRLGVRYVAWFNRRYERVGHLYQSRFASRPVEDDAYLVTLLRYVWNNPVKAGLVRNPEDYPWSSRRFLGRASVLLDESQLERLLPSPLAVIATESIQDEKLAVIEPTPPRRTDAQAAALLQRFSGASSPSEFRRLDDEARQLAIRALRTQSIPYAQIARLTGMGTTSVRRAHIAAVSVPTSGVTR